MHRGDVKTDSVTHLPCVFSFCVSVCVFETLLMGFKAVIIGTEVLVTQLLPIRIEYQLSVNVYG